MADDLNKKMDSMLRTFAKKRADAPDLVMHPATRRMLHAEAQRLYGKRKPARAGWKAFLPQIAFGSAVCLIVALTIAVLNMAPTEQKLAKTDTRSSPVMREKLAGIPEERELNEEQPEHRLALVPELDSAKESRFQAATPPRQEATDAAVSTSFLSRDQADPVAANAHPLEVLGESRQARLEQARSATAPEPLILSKSVADVLPVRPEPLEARDLTNLGAALRTRFVQTNAVGSPILQSFQVEQLGAQLKFIDLDGSVYAGAIQSQEDPLNPTSLTLDRQIEPDILPNASVVYFRAAGSNRTFGRAVQISGRLFNRTNTGMPADVRLRLSGSPAPGGGPNAAIVGRAVINGTNEVPVRAISLEK